MKPSAYGVLYAILIGAVTGAITLRQLAFLDVAVGVTSLTAGAPRGIQILTNILYVLFILVSFIPKKDEVDGFSTRRHKYGRTAQHHGGETYGKRAMAWCIVKASDIAAFPRALLKRTKKCLKINESDESTSRFCRAKFIAPSAEGRSGGERIAPEYPPENGQDKDNFYAGVGFDKLDSPASFLPRLLTDLRVISEIKHQDYEVSTTQFCSKPSATSSDMFDIFLQVITLFALGFYASVLIMGISYCPVEYSFFIGLLLHHVSEYLAVWIYKPNKLGWDSFLLNNTIFYTISISLSLAEHSITGHYMEVFRNLLAFIRYQFQDGNRQQLYVWRSLKEVFRFLILPRRLSRLLQSHTVLSTQVLWPVRLLTSFYQPYSCTAMFSWRSSLDSLSLQTFLRCFGALIFFGAVLLRISSFFRLKQNFSHRITVKKESHHKLVVNGIYKYVRHPSYMGVFWWCIGSQMMLFNPICGTLFWFALRRFFKHRIRYEEGILTKQFGIQYEIYQQNTRRSGVPFTENYKRK